MYIHFIGEWDLAVATFVLHKQTNYINACPVSSKTERGEGKPLPHMLAQEREEGEFLGVGGARLEVVGRREVGEEGRLEGGGRTPSHHSLQLSDTLREGRGDDTLQSLIVMFMFCANLAFSQASCLSGQSIKLKKAHGLKHCLANECSIVKLNLLSLFTISW